MSHPPFVAPLPVWLDALGAGRMQAELAGAKYERGGSPLLASSTSGDWKPGIAAEIRQHSELHCSGFSQPVNEVAITLRGRAEIERKASGPKQRLDLRPGLACLCPRDVDVGYLHIHHGTIEMLHVYLPNDLFGLVAPERTGALAGLKYLGGVQDPLIARIGEELAAAVRSPTRSLAGSLLVDSLGVALAARIVVNYAAAGAARKTIEQEIQRPRGRLDAARLNRVVDFMQEHVGEVISLQDLASQAHMSRFHFLREFKYATGQTPLSFVTMLKVERAKKLLRQKNDIEFVAATLGFSSGSNFSRTFKRLTGISPGAYRENA